MPALPTLDRSPTHDRLDAHHDPSWSGDAPSASHCVQFYETDEFLEVAVADFLIEGLVEGQAAVVIATAAHRECFRRRLEAQGVDVEQSLRNGLLTLLDARRTLESFMRDGTPHEGLFRAVVGPVLVKAAAAGSHPSVRAYGEMVDLLWEDGETAAALRLEAHWNVLAQTHTFSLLCAYRMGHFMHASSHDGLHMVCGTHAQVLAAEPARHAQPADTAAEVRMAVLEERARTLESELAHRRVIEQRLRDTLREREAREHGTQRLESLGLLAGGIAHDFNNLLSPILIDAEQLVGELAVDSEPYLLAKEIALAARHAGTLTHQLLAYAGRGQFVRANVRLDAMAEEIALLLHTVLPTGASLRLDVQPVASVHGDRAQLTQVVLNLVKNAADALQDQAGQVDVSVREDTDATSGMRGVVLEVRDTGTGMSPEVVARMFDPFFTTKSVGHGLGLSATLGVVKAHQGRITVDSAKGVGSTIRVWLPAVEDGESATAPTTGEHAIPERTATVVIADDEPAMRRILARQLGRAGYRVLQAEHGREALELLAAHNGEVDLALLDVTMPVMGGVATLRAIQDQFPNVKPVLMSGYTDSPIDASEDHPNTWFIAKPFGVSELHRLLDRVRTEELTC